MNQHTDQPVRIPTFGVPTPEPKVRRGILAARHQARRDLRSEEARIERHTGDDDGWARARAEARAATHIRYIHVLTRLLEMTR